MQSPDEARTLRRNAASACCSSVARRSLVRSRRIFTKPWIAPCGSAIGIISPLAQNREPSFFWCQRSSLPRPFCSAAFISACGTPARRSSMVKKLLAGWPTISASSHPRIRRAPSFQLINRQSRSSAMTA